MNLSKYIVAIIQQYDLGKRLGYWMADNDATNDVCLTSIASTFSSIDPVKQRLRCIGHILNLVAQALLMGEGLSAFQRELSGASFDDQFKLWNKQGPIGKLHNLAVYINWNDDRRAAFRSAIQDANEKVQDEEQLLTIHLIADGGIRWNSTFYMIRRALKMRQALEIYCALWKKAPSSNRDLKEDFLSEDDWAELQLFHDLLVYIERLTIKLQGQANRPGKEGGYGSIWQSIKAMDYLLSKLETEKEKFSSTSFPQYYKAGV